MKITLLGVVGCQKCHETEEMVYEVLRELAVDAAVEKITDFKKIAEYGVAIPPGIVINGKVKLSGKIPSKAEITQIITSVLMESE